MGLGHTALSGNAVLASDGQRTIPFGLIHDDLALNAGHGIMRQQDTVDEIVQRRQVVAPDAQQIIRLARHRPDRHDARFCLQQTQKRTGAVRGVARHLDLNEGLHIQIQFEWVEPGDRGPDQTVRFQSGAPPSRLTGRQVQGATKRVCRKCCIALNKTKKMAVGFIKHG